MSHSRSSYLEFVTEALGPLGRITSRAMFGGWCLYCDGDVFALISDGALYLKADQESRAKFERAGLRPFRPYEDHSIVMSYYQAPPELFEDEDALLEWGGAAVQAGRRAAEKKRGGTRKRRRAGV